MCFQVLRTKWSFGFPVLKLKCPDLPLCLPVSTCEGVYSPHSTPGDRRKLATDGEYFPHPQHHGAGRPARRSPRVAASYQLLRIPQAFFLRPSARLLPKKSFLTTHASLPAR